MQVRFVKAQQRWFMRLVAACAFGSGIFDLYSLVDPGLHAHTRVLLEFFPIEFIHLSRLLDLFLGFTLAVSSLNLLRRKRRGFQLVLLLLLLSVVLHLVKGLAKGVELEHVAVSLVAIALLLVNRKSYTVGSGTPHWRAEGPGLAVAFLLALGYGIAGFWFLDRREFGLNFTFWDSLHRTLRYLALFVDPQITPQTRHARWFVDSLYLMSFLLLGTVIFSAFRPVLYQFRTHPREHAYAQTIVKRYGRTSVDYFKAWPDKSYLFSLSQRSFVAYRVSGSFAVALGDPVGPEEEYESMTRQFLEFCRDNDWGFAFHQAAPDWLPLYRRLGLRKLRIGDEAIVDLTQFQLDGKDKKGLRHKVNQMDKSGVSCHLCPPPIPLDVLASARQVSDAWLDIPGRRERTFTLGTFDPGYVRYTPLFLVEDAEGRLLAFANLIPSYAPGESTIDLMRHRPDAPNGIMDYLMVKLFEHERGRGFTRFNLGLAPMAGFQERADAPAEERAVQLFFQSLNFLFSYRGLRHYKAKFATSWEPRYVIFRRPLDLPRLALALNQISTIRENK